MLQEKIIHYFKFNTLLNKLLGNCKNISWNRVTQLFKLYFNIIIIPITVQNMGNIGEWSPICTQHGYTIYWRAEENNTEATAEGQSVQVS